MFIKKKYIAVFMIKEQNSYEIDFRKRFKPTEIDDNGSINYNEQGYPLNLSIKSYSKGLSIYYCFDIESKKQLFFVLPKDNFYGSKALDLILAKKIIPDLTMDLSNTGFKKNIYNFVLGCIIGALSGFLISGFF